MVCDVELLLMRRMRLIDIDTPQAELAGRIGYLSVCLVGWERREGFMKSWRVGVYLGGQARQSPGDVMASSNAKLQAKIYALILQRGPSKKLGSISTQTPGPPFEGLCKVGEIADTHLLIFVRVRLHYILFVGLGSIIRSNKLTRILSHLSGTGKIFGKLNTKQVPHDFSQRTSL